MLNKTRHIWKRRAQAWLFDIAGMQGLLDERETQRLEDHMGFHGQLPEHRRFQIEELKKLGLQAKHNVLEIGCGPLTAGIPVIQYLDPDHYVGVDVRSNVLDAAWQQIGRYELSAKNPRLIRSDNFGSEELGDRRFDYVWSFSVLFHLSDDILDRLFAAVAGRLAKGGIFVANVQTDLESSTWLQFPFLKRTIGDYRKAAAKHGFQTVDLGTIEERGFRLPGLERTNPLLKFTLEA
jgi:cyclopropane fatty-acyl-phospholipid synthase-like methyltransferase